MDIEQIVAAYVRLQNRQALEDLRAHRQRLLADLKSRSGSVYDLSALHNIRGMQPDYTEYTLAIMRAASRFPIKLSTKVNQRRDVLPKAEQAKPRKIQVT